MQTKFNVGDEVRIKGQIAKISIYKDSIVYDVKIDTQYDNVNVRCREDNNDILKLEGEDDA